MARHCIQEVRKSHLELNFMLDFWGGLHCSGFHDCSKTCPYFLPSFVWEDIKCLLWLPHQLYWDWKYLTYLEHQHSSCLTFSEKHLTAASHKNVSYFIDTLLRIEARIITGSSVIRGCLCMQVSGSISIISRQAQVWNAGLPLPVSVEQSDMIPRITPVSKESMGLFSLM